MVKRDVALCNGKLIGIESIFTVINGQQINVPEKLKELRDKSQRNELYCPCGCGTNLILVAGDKRLRDQHFREKYSKDHVACTMVTEGKISLYSKIVLKCWLDDKLMTNDLESRVPIGAVEETKRRPEFSFLSKTKKFAIRYWHMRTNIMEERLDILESNISGIQVMYIVDESNGGVNGQYPEALMRIQSVQKYCFLLRVEGFEYDKATLAAVFYDKDINGLWKEYIIAKGLLNTFGFNKHNEIVFQGKSIGQLYSEARTRLKEFIKKQQQHIEEEKRQKEKGHGTQEDIFQRYQAISGKEVIKALHLQNDRKEKCELEPKMLQDQKKQSEKEIRANIEDKFTQQDTPIIDEMGKRWVKCEVCGRIAMERDFSWFGGKGKVNLGTCKQCSKNTI